MRVLISGASGFIGGRVNSYLQSQGMKVARIVRSFSHHDIYLNYTDLPQDLSSLEGFDACLHFSGENIFGRWTQEKKERILNSRVDSTRYLSDLFCRLKKPPKVFVISSATGFYGDQGDRLLTEQDSNGEGFLASVCEEWERSAEKAKSKGIRVVHLRQGMVLGKNGGSMKLLTPLYKMCLGGILGTGRQYISWIHIKDLERIISFVLEHPLSGPINCCSPNPIQQKEFANALSRALHRVAFMPVPAPIIKLFMGQMGKEMLLYSTRAYPQLLLKNGFEFQFPDLYKSFLDIVN